MPLTICLENYLPPHPACDLDGIDHMTNFIMVINLKLSNVLLNLELAEVYLLDIFWAQLNLKWTKST